MKSGKDKRQSLKMGCLFFMLASFGSASLAADNQLSEQEKSDGWILLFDGATLNGWMNSNRQPSKRPVEDGSLNPHKCGGYLLIHEKKWEDFILSLDFRINKGTNSGIYVRTDSLIFPRKGNVNLNGIEVAIDDTRSAGYHDTGAFYDLVKPKRNAMKPAGEWNHIVITCDRNIITVQLNGVDVSRMDLDEWTKPGLRLDGTKHKFINQVPKNHARSGYIGFQDHGGEAWFKNIKIKPLNVVATQVTSTRATE
jgi:hypothetical protein